MKSKILKGFLESAARWKDTKYMFSFNALINFLENNTRTEWDSYGKAFRLDESLIFLG